MQFIFLLKKSHHNKYILERGIMLMQMPYNEIVNLCEMGQKYKNKNMLFKKLRNVFLIRPTIKVLEKAKKNETFILKEDIAEFYYFIKKIQTITGTDIMYIITEESGPNISFTVLNNQNFINADIQSIKVSTIDTLTRQSHYFAVEYMQNDRVVKRQEYSTLTTHRGIVDDSVGYILYIYMINVIEGFIRFYNE